MNTLIIDKSGRREYQRRLYADHLFFVGEIWKDRGLSQKAPLGVLEHEMLDWMYKGPRLRGILGARGLGKTTLLVAPLAVYRLFRDPNRKIMIVSKSATAAKETIGLCRSWIDHVWFLQHLAPVRGEQPDNTNEFDVGPCARGVTKQPSVKAIGNDGMLEGNRANTYMMDDAETKENTRTQTAREELVRTVGNEATNIVYAVDDALDPNELIDIGTYKCEDSFHKRLNARGYEFRTYPIAYPQVGDQFIGLSPIIQKRLDTGEAKYTVEGKYDENPAFPNFFKPSVIKERMGSGLLDFGMENMLVVNPGKQTGPPMRLSNLIVAAISRDDAPIRYGWGESNPIGDIACEGLTGDRLYGPEYTDITRQPFQTTIAVIDPAGGGKDLSGVAIMSYLSGLFFLKHARGHEGGAETHQMVKYAVLFRQHNVRCVWVESNIDVFGNRSGSQIGTFAPALAIECRKLQLEPNQHPDYPRGWTCAVESFRSHGAFKEDRICSTLVPVLGSNRMIVDPSVLRGTTGDNLLEPHQTFQYQLTRIRPIKKWLTADDTIDAVASAVIQLQKTTYGMSRAPEIASEKTRLREFKDFQKRMEKRSLPWDAPTPDRRVIRPVV